MFEYKQKKIIQKKELDHIEKHCNSTGIPDHMKAYAEKLYGSSLDDVRVHYNSENPSRFNALGYTQENNVYLGPGQEKHLMHELCHVIQQKRGIVKPTSIEGGHAINDSIILEKEAEYCEKQYEKETPIQMLRDKAKQGSVTMQQEQLNSGNIYRYHVVGYFTLQCKDGSVIQDSVWSNKGTYERQEKGGDHAEDAICDTIEWIDFQNYICEILNVSSKFTLEDAILTIKLSSSPCQRCQARLNEIAQQYNIKINVIAAKEYSGKAGGGAGNTEDNKYNLEILTNEENSGKREELLQF